MSSTARRIFYDTEFHEDGQTIDLISIGMVAEHTDPAGGVAEELYLVNADADWVSISRHDWLAANVLPHLPGGWHAEPLGDVWLPDRSHPAVVSMPELRDRVRAWLRLRAREGAAARLDCLARDVNDWQAQWHDLELWAYYAAYDHVALAQLFGPMVKLPPFMPMWTNDLCQLAEAKGVKVRDLEQLVPRASNGNEHHALADADWNRRVRAVLAGHGTPTP